MDRCRRIGVAIGVASVGGDLVDHLHQPSESVTVWSKGSLASHWVVERSYQLHYARRTFDLTDKPGQATTLEDGRAYAWWPQGTDPNQEPTS